MSKPKVFIHRNSSTMSNEYIQSYLFDNNVDVLNFTKSACIKKLNFNYYIGKYIPSEYVASSELIKIVQSGEKFKITFEEMRNKCKKLIDFLRLTYDITSNDITFEDKEFDSVEEYFKALKGNYNVVKVISKDQNKRWVISPIITKPKVIIPKKVELDNITIERIKEKDCCFCLLNYTEIDDTILQYSCCANICCEKCQQNYEQTHKCPCCRNSCKVDYIM